jgi:hypothetical protein
MYDKRAILAVAGLASAALLAGCATSKEGAGTFAGAVVGPPSSSAPTQPTPTGLPSDDSPSPTATTPPIESSEVPTEPPATTEDPSTRRSGNVDLEDDGAICELISDADLQKIFGQKPRLFPDSGGPSCTYKNADGDQIILGEYYNLVPSEQIAEDKKYKTGARVIKTTIGGRPAQILMENSDYGTGYIYVAETKNFAAEGVVEALVNNDPKLQRIAKALLAKVVPKYAH